MKALHRTLGAGGFGLLAVATVAAGAGYACTASQQISINVASGPPGATINVQGYGFEPRAEFAVRWDSANGAVLGTTYVMTVESAGLGRPQAEVAVTIPAEAVARPEPYTIVGIQSADGTVRRAVTTFTVTSPSPVAVPPAATAPEQPAATEAPESVPQLPVVPPAPAAPGATPTPAPAARPAPSAGAVRPQPQAAAAGRQPGASISPAAAVATPAAAGQERAPAPAAATSPAAQVPDVPTPVAGDLWSGVGIDRSPGLLGPSSSPGQSGGAPVGALLLGLGALILAGIALPAARRRLVLARQVAPRR